MKTGSYCSERRRRGLCGCRAAGAISSIVFPTIPTVMRAREVSV
jgi:hypothetical protein